MYLGTKRINQYYHSSISCLIAIILFASSDNVNAVNLWQRNVIQPIEFGVRSYVSSKTLTTAKKPIRYGVSSKTRVVSSDPIVLPTSSLSQSILDKATRNDNKVSSSFPTISSYRRPRQRRRISPESNNNIATVATRKLLGIRKTKQQIHQQEEGYFEMKTLDDNVVIDGDGDNLNSNGDLSVVEDVKQKMTISSTPSDTTSRGGSSAIRSLLFWETMVCGAISRSIAQTVMHPANTMKTLLQSSKSATTDGTKYTIRSLATIKSLPMLTRGAGANFLLSVPHGAVNFAVLEYVRHRIGAVVDNIPVLERNKEKLGPGLDFLSSAISTITCSVVSTPQMMVVDNIMVGNYPNLPKAITGLAQSQGIHGFYAGWLPGLVGKIPSYALTWTLFQQAKRVHYAINKRSPKDVENSIMGAMASATTVCIMIPMDTIKTRLVTQISGGVAGSGFVPYKGIVDCAVRVAKEEGIGAFYRGLPPRLLSVVPMIGIQFGVYEYMKKVMLSRSIQDQGGRKKKQKVVEELEYGKEQELLEAAMESASSESQPEPAPHFHGAQAKRK